MKDIGRTNEGNHLIELTEDEYRALSRLTEALSGSFDRGVLLNHRMMGIDVSNAFVAVLAFATYKEVVNELKELTDSLDKVVMWGQDDPKPL